MNQDTINLTVLGLSIAFKPEADMFALALLFLAHLADWQCAAIGAALTLLLRWRRRNKTA